MANDNDDWEVAVDTGEFDKRLEQQEKARAANQESAMTSLSSTTNDDENRNFSSINLMNSNKPIRILKRPTSQTQLPTTNNQTKTVPTSSNSTISNTNSNETDDANSSSTSTNTSSSTNVSNPPIIPRIQTRDSTNSSATVLNSSTSQVNKPAIKTYEQRELEYRLARLRIMGEEESSVKDDDDDPSPDSTTNPSDDPSKSTTSPLSASSTLRATNKPSGHSQTSLQSHSTPGSYASNLYTLNNVQPNAGAIHFNPHNNDSTPNIGSGPYSTANMPQNYRNTYSIPYSHIPPGNPSRYPLSSTSNPSYMPPPLQSAPFMNALTSSQSPSSSNSYPYTPQQYSNLTTNNWYNYSYPSGPSGTQTFGHPQ